MTIWTYYQVDADEQDVLRELETGLDIMPRMAWRTADEAKAAAEKRALDDWREYRDDCAAAGVEFSDEPKPLEWARLEREAYEGDGRWMYEAANHAGGCSFVVYSLELA